jgi:hypothetical protein
VIGFNLGPGPGLQLVQPHHAPDRGREQPEPYASGERGALVPWRPGGGRRRRPRPGRIPSRGDGDMELVMTVPSGSFGADPAAAAGEGHGGRRGAAGRRRQGAREGRWGSLAGCSSCTPSRTLGVPRRLREMEVRSQVCKDHTKLSSQIRRPAALLCLRLAARSSRAVHIYNMLLCPPLSQKRFVLAAKTGFCWRARHPPATLSQ